MTKYYFTYCKIIADAATNNDKSDDISTLKEKHNSMEELDKIEKASNDIISESQDQAPDENSNLIMSSNENYNSPEKQKISEKESSDELSEPKDHLMSEMENSTPRKKPSSSSNPTMKSPTKSKSPSKRKTELEQLKGENDDEEENLGPRRKKRESTETAGE